MSRTAEEYPRLVFGKSPKVTVRYFADKLPIGYDHDQRRHVFMYFAGSPSPMDFRVFILRHLELLNALGFWTIRDWSRGRPQGRWRDTRRPPTSSSRSR